MFEGLSLYGRYLRRLQGYTFPLITGILSDFFSTFLTMIPPLFSILLFDYAFPQRDLSLLSGAVLAGLGIYFINFFFSSLNDYLNVHMDQKIGTTLASDLFQKILRLPLSVQAKRNSGDLTIRILQDSDLVAGMILNTPQVLVIEATALVLYLLISLAIDPYVTLLSLGAIPVYMLETHFFSKRLEQLQKDVQSNSAETLEGLQERLLNIRTIKAYGKEVREGNEFNRYLDRRFRLSLKQKVISFVSAFSNSVTLQIWSTFVTWYIGYEVIQGRLSIGQMLALGAYLPQLAGPIHALSNLYTNFRVGMISLRRVDEILSLASEAHTSTGEEVILKKGHIQLQGLSFRYEPLHAVLKDVSLEIRPGSCLAIVGESGTGKSTLVNLLLRFYEPTGGMILIDGHDVQQIHLASLRRQIGIVFQEVSLFSGTVRENILYGNPDCSERDLYEAARLAAAHDFILRLPQGYDTRVERFGQNLSGGQRQRIAIARALATKPRILVLDEAVSALDAESEFLIQETIDRCRGKMTVILVAHRFSSIKGMDQIVVFDEGRIVECGSFAELLERKGVFFTLYQLQMGGFEEFQQRLHIEFARTQRYKQDLSLLIFRLNEYDRYANQEKTGRMARLMEEVNLFIRRYLRIMDFSSVFKDNHVIVGLPQTSYPAAKNFSLRIQQRIASHSFAIDGKVFRFTVSVKVSSCQEGKVRYAEELIEKAEQMSIFPAEEKVVVAG